MGWYFTLDCHRPRTLKSACSCLLRCAGLRAKLDLQKDGLYLYRNMLPLGISSIAFVGCEVGARIGGLQAAHVLVASCGFYCLNIV